MKFTQIFLIVLIFSHFFQQELNSQVDLDDYTIAHFDFNGSPEDKSGNGYHGNVLGATLVQDRFGNCEYAYEFRKSPNVVSIPNEIMDGLESFSVSIWLKTSNPGVAMTAANGVRHNEFFIQIMPDDFISVTVRANISKIKQRVEGSISIMDNEWHHVAVTRNHVNGEMAIYIDGVLDIKTKVLLAGNAIPKLPLNISKNGLHIGADQDCIGGCWDATQQVIGKIDDVWFFNKTISKEEVLFLRDINESETIPQLMLESEIQTCDNMQILDAGSGFDSYEWNTGETTQTIVVDSSGGYEVRATFNNCEYNSEVNVVFDSPSIVVIASDSSIRCNQGVMLTASSGHRSYNWSNGASGQTVEVNMAGLYFVTAVGPCGELTSETISVSLVENDELRVQTSQQSLNCLSDVVFIQASDGFENYLWSNGMSGRQIQVEVPGQYTVTAINECGESLSTSVEITGEAIEDIFIPNTFTPNGDGLNEFFEIDHRLLGSWMRIVNRWGNQVYESLEYMNDWNGGSLSDGSYYFLIKHPCLEQDFKGWINIVR
ncbi:MAG: gliding motility-associated-like protein [Cyclobacteriaceae bacterium]|jgi:gliding motility-associated-like protein